MQQELRAKAETALADVETALAPLPELSGEIVALEAAPPDARAAIEARMAEIDLANTQSIVTFGSKAQEQLTQISAEMLEGVRNKDTGPAGDALSRMVTSIKGFDVSELDPNRKRSWWERLLGKATPVATFMAQYEEVRVQIDRIADDLLGHETVLLKDIKFLDRLYEKTLDFYHELGLYIAAGEARLSAIDAGEVPAKEAAVAAAPEGEAVLAAQQLRDLRAARDDLERRVHDMKLTRQVTMQSLPSIRLVQENDKSLVGKIKSTLVNTVPLWETQLAQAVTIARSRDAAGAVKGATDLTNELLRKNAENLQMANREVREQMERGVFDIEAVREANDRLIATIDESLQIADEGKKRRAAAEQELVKMEGELKAALASAKALERGAPGGEG
ncbi:MAG: toxic anion resistance protein [Rhodobacteraceae bacterium]|nr:MAG: toxic anion resistance protein [Paracoccaceae bacterium]